MKPNEGHGSGRYNHSAVSCGNWLPSENRPEEPKHPIMTQHLSRTRTAKDQKKIWPSQNESENQLFYRMTIFIFLPLFRWDDAKQSGKKTNTKVLQKYPQMKQREVLSWCKTLILEGCSVNMFFLKYFLPQQEGRSWETSLWWSEGKQEKPDCKLR